MADERLVINTGPLIALAKAGALDVAGQLAIEIICPAEVKTELDAGLDVGYQKVKPDWLRVESLRHPLDPVANVTLGSGEAAVIQLALEQRIPRVCIDEVRGRRTASAVGLQVVGTLGLLLRAKKLGVVAAVHPYIERLQKAGDWYSAALIRRVLEAAGESD